MVHVLSLLLLSVPGALSKTLFENKAEVRFSGRDYGSSTGWKYQFRSSADVQWGSLKYKVDNVDTSVENGYVHVTFVEFDAIGGQAVRIVDSVGATKMMREHPMSSVQHLLNIDTGSGEFGVTTEYVYSWARDGWICLEWNTDAARQHAALYENGTQAFSVDSWHFGWQTYRIPSDLNVRIGMRTYNGIQVSGSFKDVVVATERIGCGSNGSSPTTAPTQAPTHAPSPTPSPTPIGDNCISQPWQQCGGRSWSGVKCCTQGLKCMVINEWYSQCEPSSFSKVVNAAAHHQKKEGFLK